MQAVCGMSTDEKSIHEGPCVSGGRRHLEFYLKEVMDQRLPVWRWNDAQKSRKPVIKALRAAADWEPAS